MKNILLLLIIVLIALGVVAYLNPGFVSWVKETTGTASTSTKVYKWQDEDGKWHVTNEPPFYRIPSPAEVARELNQRFPVYAQSNQFFTFLYGILDTSDLSFTSTRAGHPGHVHLSTDHTRICETAGGIRRTTIARTRGSGVVFGAIWSVGQLNRENAKGAKDAKG